MSEVRDDGLAHPVSYRDVGGMLCHRAMTPVEEDVELPGSALAARHVRMSDGDTLLQKWVPEADGRFNSRLYDLLDAEIRASAALAQRYGGRRYPAELSALVGYNVDLTEPFVLLRPYRGKWMPSRRFDPEKLRAVEVALLRALQHTAEAGVVHGNVGLHTLRWDGTTVQLVDFEHAQRAGERRRPGGSVPHRSPEQVDGVGGADPRDDVWGAGMVITHLAIGPHSGQVDAPRPVQTLLEGVFIDDAAHRPSAATLLARLDLAVSPPLMAAADDPLEPGRVLFDQVVGRKRAAAGPPRREPVASTPATELLPQGRTSRLVVAAAAVIVTILLVAVVILVNQ
jgi:hypothetical protein